MSNNGRYILVDRRPVPEPILLKWARWLETADRVVAQDTVREACGDGVAGVEVSTVFLGLDQIFRNEGAPVLFETKVFGGIMDGERERYSTWAEAEAGHQRMLERVRAAVNEVEVDE